jgi:hypothetical protein
LEPSYEELYNVVRDCDESIVSKTLSRYGNMVELAIVLHVLRSNRLNLTSSVGQYCIENDTMDLLHENIGEQEITLTSCHEDKYMEYISKYPNDKVFLNNLASLHKDENIFKIITENRVKDINMSNLVGKEGINMSLIYIVVNGLYSTVNSVIECELDSDIYKLLDMSKFNLFTCSNKSKVLVANMKFGFLRDTDIVRQYFMNDKYNELYLRSIGDKSINVTIQLKKKGDIELLNRAVEYGLTGVKMRVHYDDEVVGKGTPCFMHILLDLMKPSDLYIVDIVRPSYIDNIVRVLNSYVWNSSKPITIYHEGIMDYYYRYPKGVVDYIKQCKQDLVLAMEIINGPPELIYLLDDQYKCLVN